MTVILADMAEVEILERTIRNYKRARGHALTERSLMLYQRGRGMYPAQYR
jgi:hypothetical protein